MSTENDLKNDPEYQKKNEKKLKEINKARDSKKHFEEISRLIRLWNKDSTFDTGERIWKEHIEPKLGE